MRLLNIATQRLEQFFDEEKTEYAILSHTWGSHEPTYQDFLNKPAAVLRTPKVKGVMHMATTESRPLQYVWIDTICIDKTSSAELQEAINSMYKWYENAAVCYAYITDVDIGKVKSTAVDDAFRNSRWFTRGWTLQELLAPSLVYFHDVAWRPIGEKSLIHASHLPNKRTERSLLRLISKATNIPAAALNGKMLIESYSVGQRMSWAASRRTVREEDRAYSLMGLFGVNMPMLYGEGAAAFLRLQDEIMKRTDDHSLLAYNYHHIPTFTPTDHLNPHLLTPADYVGCSVVKRLRSSTLYDESRPSPRARDGSYARASGLSSLAFNTSMEHYVMTNKGLYIELDVLEVPKLPGMLVARLNCIFSGKDGKNDEYDEDDEDDEDDAHLKNRRVVVMPLYQPPTLRGSRLALRTPGAPLVDLPSRLFTRNVTRCQLYVTNKPFAATTHTGKSVLRLMSFGQPFIVSDIYPAIFSSDGNSVDVPQLGCRVMSFTYAHNEKLRHIYMRLRFEERNFDCLVAVTLKYDARNIPRQATCSVAHMVENKSLLELLVLDEYPPPYGGRETSVSSFKHSNPIKDKERMQFINSISVDVSIDPRRTNCTQLTLRTME